MGSREAEAYLASPAVVAASAIAGIIDYPGNWEDYQPAGKTSPAEKSVGGAGAITILPGFPETLDGELIFCHQDNLNTDGIYPGKYTYMDDFTAEQQAQVVMENYDPEFTKLVKKGDILVGGFNFGTGSSREQAATALMHRGLALVIAGSFSETYKRNALNNGFLSLEAPELVSDLKEKFGETKLTVRTGFKAKLDFRTAQMEANGKQYQFSPVGKAAQELVLVGGLEKWVRARLE
jgi:homoaconitate hydratase